MQSRVAAAAWSGLLASTACNQAFDLSTTHLFDAPPPDASPTCPMYGQTPDYAGTLHQVIAQNCSDYTFSTTANLAVAVCGTGIFQGPIGGALTPVPGLPIATTFEWREKPRLVPDATRMFVRHIIPDPGTETLETYDLVGTTWQLQGELTELGAPDWMSNVVVSSSGYRLLATTAGSIDEWEYSGTWQHVRTMPVTDLGLTTAAGPTLTPDGLGVIVHAFDATQGQYRPYYADRPSQADPFGPARPLDGLPTPIDNTISIADGCTGAYLTGLDAVFFSRRR